MEVVNSVHVSTDSNIAIINTNNSAGYYLSLWSVPSTGLVTCVLNPGLTEWYSGFTEDAFNFQDDNFGNGGAGNDRVRVSVQAPGCMFFDYPAEYVVLIWFGLPEANNANFAVSSANLAARLLLTLIPCRLPQSKRSQIVIYHHAIYLFI